MRIIAGNLKGRQLKFPAQGAGIRPTSDRVREAIFSTLASLKSLEGSVVLDLFAGSGALGIEAISRGAKFSTFVDNDRPITKILTDNLASLGLSEISSVHCGDVLDTLEKKSSRLQLGGRIEKFDVVFADPPYALNLSTELIAAILRSQLLVPGGLIVLEGNSKLRLAEQIDAGEEVVSRARLIKSREYGDTLVGYYSKE